MSNTHSKQYIDEYGDIWVKLDDYYVKRLKDGNIGTWQDGKGLEPYGTQ